jgi:HK97 family phage prohead protease
MTTRNRPPLIEIPAMPASWDRYRQSVMGGRRRIRDVEPEAEEEPLRILGSDGKPMRQPALQGWAAIYNKAFEHSRRVVYLKSGCFISTIHDGKRKRLLLDHNDAHEVGSTDVGLEFENSLKGLAFRMPLAGNPSARRIADTVGAAERACASVGIRFTEHRTYEVDGLDVDIVDKAELFELSLVSQGAIANTFARVVDLEYEEKLLWSACRSPKFATDQLVTDMQVRIRRVTENLRKLAD